MVQAGATDADAPEARRLQDRRTHRRVAGRAQIGERLPQKTVTCQVPTERLTIDGLLSDVGWQEAVEIPLSTSAVPLAGNAPHAFVMFAHDAQFLYFAASIPRVPGMPKDGPMTLGRTHDMDLSAYDRIALFLDVDRDGVTWYEIDIDQRGCIAESCWNDAELESDHRRPRRRGRRALADRGDDSLLGDGAAAAASGEAWGLAIVRTVPAVKQEAWVPPASTKPRPESFGLLRFQ